MLLGCLFGVSGALQHGGLCRELECDVPSGKAGLQPGTLLLPQLPAWAFPRRHRSREGPGAFPGGMQQPQSVPRQVRLPWVPQGSAQSLLPVLPRGSSCPGLPRAGTVPLGACPCCGLMWGESCWAVERLWEMRAQCGHGWARRSACQGCQHGADTQPGGFGSLGASSRAGQCETPPCTALAPSPACCHGLQSLQGQHRAVRAPAPPSAPSSAWDKALLSLLGTKREGKELFPWQAAENVPGCSGSSGRALRGASLVLGTARAAPEGTQAAPSE